jgi:hypothetical protein
MTHSNSFCLRFFLAFVLALPQQAQQKKEETVTFTSTMGPGIRVDPIAAQALSSGGATS